MKKTFKIPVVWQMWGIISVEAKNLKEAKEKVYSMSLPRGEYIDDSFEIDEEGIQHYN